MRKMRDHVYEHDGVRNEDVKDADDDEGGEEEDKGQQTLAKIKTNKEGVRE